MVQKLRETVWRFILHFWKQKRREEVLNNVQGFITRFHKKSILKWARNKRKMFGYEKLFSHCLFSYGITRVAAYIRTFYILVWIFSRKRWLNLGTGGGWYNNFARVGCGYRWTLPPSNLQGLQHFSTDGSIEYQVNERRKAWKCKEIVFVEKSKKMEELVAMSTGYLQHTFHIKVQRSE